MMRCWVRALSWKNTKIIKLKIIGPISFFWGRIGSYFIFVAKSSAENTCPGRSGLLLSINHVTNEVVDDVVEMLVHSCDPALGKRRDDTCIVDAFLVFRLLQPQHVRKGGREHGREERIYARTCGVEIRSPMSSEMSW